ncbi:hypothetical protein GCM10018953_00170 [Streptosporangium nondiastaticum]
MVTVERILFRSERAAGTGGESGIPVGRPPAGARRSDGPDLRGPEAGERDSDGAAPISTGPRRGRPGPHVVLHGLGARAAAGKRSRLPRDGLG